MEEQYDPNQNYINRMVMISEQDHLPNVFYRVVRETEKMFYMRRIQCETVKMREEFDETGKLETTVYETKIGATYEEGVGEKKIRKENIVKYPWIYCGIIQYEK